MLVFSVAIDMSSVAIPNGRFLAGLLATGRVVRVVVGITSVLERRFRDG